MATTPSEDKFAVEVNEEVTLRRDSMVEHAEHGPMRVDSIRVGPHSKTVEFKSEMGPVGLDLSAEDIREQWGETIAQDPFDLHEPGTAKISNSGISVEGSEIEVDITVSGPEDDAEMVHMHSVDQIVRALQGVRDEKPPWESEGGGYEIDWETVFEDD